MSEHLISAESSFSQVIDQVRATKGECIKTYGVGGKRLCHYYDATDIPSGNKDPPDKGKIYLQPIDFP